MPFFLLIVIFSFCFQSCTALCKEEKLSYGILNSFAREQKLENNLNLTGFGGSIPDSIHAMNISLVSHEKVDLNRARQLYLECVLSLLSKVNADAQIRPYLHHYPFNESNLRFSLGFEDDLGRHASQPYIAHVFMTEGKIFYSTYDHKLEEFRDAHEETYEEALNKVKGKG